MVNSCLRMQARLDGGCCALAVCLWKCRSCICKVVAKAAAKCFACCTLDVQPFGLGLLVIPSIEVHPTDRL